MHKSISSSSVYLLVLTHSKISESKRKRLIDILSITHVFKVKGSVCVYFVFTFEYATLVDVSCVHVQ